jgi:hypothetical protein
MQKCQILKILLDSLWTICSYPNARTVKKSFSKHICIQTVIKSSMITIFKIAKFLILQLLG